MLYLNIWCASVCPKAGVLRAAVSNSYSKLANVGHSLSVDLKLFYRCY